MSILALARQSARQGNGDALAAGDDQRPRHRRKGLRQRRSLCQGQARPEREGTREQWDTNTRPLALDKIYYDDFCNLSRWAQAEKMTEQKIDFNQLTWPEGLKAINPKLVDAPPPPC